MHPATLTLQISPGIAILQQSYRYRNERRRNLFMMHRLLAMTLALTLAACGEDRWKTIGVVVTGLAVAALASASGGGLGQGGAFDPERYNPEDDTRFNHQPPRAHMR